MQRYPRVVSRTRTTGRSGFGNKKWEIIDASQRPPLQPANVCNETPVGFLGPQDGLALGPRGVQPLEPICNCKSCTQALRSKRQPKIMLNEKHPQRHKNKCRFESVAGLTESKRARHPSTWAPRRHARLKIRMPCQPTAGENQSLLIIIAPLPLEYNVCYTEYKPCHAEYYACCTRWQPKSLNSPVVSRYQGGTGWLETPHAYGC